jgi:two-component system OmpR family response regulator
MDQAVKLRTYIVEDNATIRANLIDALEELACVEAVGVAATEDEGKEWLMAHSGQWDLAIVDLFFARAAAWRAGCLPRTRTWPENGGAEQLRHPRCAYALRATGCRCGL